MDDVEDPYKLKLYKGITEKGCCKRCALRYLGYCINVTSFESPDMSLITFGLFSPLDEYEKASCTAKQEPRPCTVCLGLLEDAMIKEMLSHEALKKCSEYTHETFIPQITFPVSVLVRDYSMKLYLQKTFPEIFKVDQVTKLNITWRCSIEKKLSKILEKKYYPYKSNFIVHFNTQYVLEEEEISFIQELTKDSGGPQPGRQHIVQLLEKIPEDKLGSLFSIPPKPPFYAVTLKEVKCIANPIHLFGSYCKYARELAQAPNPQNSPNVSDIVTKALTDVCPRVEKVSFHVSNCDETDMRILGQGRYFHLELTDPKFDGISHTQCRKIEKLANRDGLIKITNLREMHRKEILQEMGKQNCNARTYKVLCIVMECRNLDHSINAINMYQTVTVAQKTPIKVLHQRPFWKRIKTIFYIKAKKIRDNLIEVEMCAQTGLYISEFVNGDFGRTEPSLSDIMRAKVDAVAMDIVDFQSTASYAADIEDVVI